jgi:hypothetical protein
MPARIASSASLFGRPVLTPTRVPSASTISSVWAYLRFGLSDVDSQTREPGSVSPIIEPVFGTAQVISSPPSSRTISARKRL